MQRNPKIADRSVGNVPFRVFNDAQNQMSNISYENPPSSDTDLWSKTRDSRFGLEWTSFIEELEWSHSNVKWKSSGQHEAFESSYGSFGLLSCFKSK